MLRLLPVKVPPHRTTKLEKRTKFEITLIAFLSHFIFRQIPSFLIMQVELFHLSVEYMAISTWMWNKKYKKTLTLFHQMAKHKCRLSKWRNHCCKYWQTNRNNRKKSMHIFESKPGGQIGRKCWKFDLFTSKNVRKAKWFGAKGSRIDGAAWNVSDWSKEECQWCNDTL
jgi:hypothetical protein